MTDEKIREVTARYRELLNNQAIARKKFPEKNLPLSDYDVVGHLSFMLDQIDSFLRQGQRDKAFLGLGFVQGGLWCLRFYTLEDLKNHNKP